MHHIIELTPDNINNPSISLNPRNLMLLCNDCHNKLHHRFEQGASSRSYSYDSEGHVVAVREKERRRCPTPPGVAFSAGAKRPAPHSCVRYRQFPEGV